MAEAARRAARLQGVTKTVATPRRPGIAGVTEEEALPSTPRGDRNRRAERPPSEREELRVARPPAALNLRAVYDPPEMRPARAPRVLLTASAGPAEYRVGQPPPARKLKAAPPTRVALEPARPPGRRLRLTVVRAQQEPSSPTVAPPARLVARPGAAGYEHHAPKAPLPLAATPPQQEARLASPPVPASLKASLPTMRGYRLAQLQPIRLAARPRARPQPSKGVKTVVNELSRLASRLAPSPHRVLSTMIQAAGEAGLGPHTPRARLRPRLELAPLQPLRAPRPGPINPATLLGSLLLPLQPKERHARVTLTPIPATVIIRLPLVERRLQIHIPPGQGLEEDIDVIIRLPRPSIDLESSVKLEELVSQLSAPDPLAPKPLTPSGAGSLLLDWLADRLAAALLDEAGDADVILADDGLPQAIAKTRAYQRQFAASGRQPKPLDWTGD